MRTRTFSDFDDFAGSVGDVDCTMMLSNATRHRWVIDALDLPKTHLQVGRLGSGNTVEGQSWSHGYLLYLPLTEACPYKANGTVVPSGSFMVLDPGCEFTLSTPSEHDWCSIFLPALEFEQVDTRSEPIVTSGKPACWVTQPTGALAQRFERIAQQIISAVERNPRFQSSPAACSAEEELVRLASSVIGRGQAIEPAQGGRPRIPRDEIIRRCRELLDRSRGKPVLLRDLVAAAGVSERTLRAAFHEYFGVGPHRYLETRRLHQAYRSLRAAEPHLESVSDVLIAIGEWEFGRFAARYRRAFGELPSQTLRRKAVPRPGL